MSGWNFVWDQELAEAPTLYHYTNLVGFVGIIESDQMWATDTRFLNDISEAQRLWTFLASRIEQFRAAGLNIPDIDLDRLDDALRKVTPPVIFVASFSESRDSLGQWRAYGGSNGICIGFKPKALQTEWVANPQGDSAISTLMLPQKVMYIPDDNRSAFDDEIATLLRTTAFWGNQNRKSPRSQELSSSEEGFVNWLRIIVASFKHSSFAEEREWRLTFQRFNRKPMMYQRFRVSKSTLVPYIAANLNQDKNRTAIVEGSYIEEVIIAPSPNMELTKTAVEQLLMVNGHEGVPVRLSAVPYRDW